MDNQNTQNLPADILKAIESSDVYTKLEKIGEKYNLMLDQVGQLNVDTECLMIGKLRSRDFVSTITKNLEIPSQTAEKIAADINNEIFMSLRESLRKMQEEAEKQVTPTQTPTPQPKTPTPPPPQNLPVTPTPASTNPSLSPIEKAGNFTIEPTKPSSSPLYNDSTLKRTEVLSDLENIEKLKPENASAFVDHLLANPVSNQQKIEIKKPVTPPTPPKPGVDPYREPI